MICPDCGTSMLVQRHLRRDSPDGYTQVEEESDHVCPAELTFGVRFIYPEGFSDSMLFDTIDYIASSFHTQIDHSARIFYRIEQEISPRHSTIATFQFYVPSKRGRHADEMLAATHDLVSRALLAQKGNLTQ
jgi:hypothetical protein